MAVSEPITFRERASDVAAPASGRQTLFAKAAGLFRRASTGDAKRLLDEDDLTGLMPVVFVRKASDESVSNSIIVQDDNELTVAVEANTTYEIDLVLRIEGPNNGDLRWELDTPNSVDVFGSYAAMAVAATNLAQATVMAANASGQQQVVGTITNETTGLIFKGTVEVGALAGSVTLQWAQGSSHADPTRVLRGSYLKLTKVS